MNEAKKVMKIGCELCDVKDPNHDHKFKRGRSSRYTEKHHQTQKKFSCSKCTYSSNLKQDINQHLRRKMHSNDLDLKVLYQDCEKCMQNIDHEHPTRRGKEGIEHDYTNGTVFKC